MLVSVAKHENDVFEMVRAAYRLRNTAYHQGETVVEKRLVDELYQAVFFVNQFMIRRVHAYKKKAEWVRRLELADARATRNFPTMVA